MENEVMSKKLVDGFVSVLDTWGVCSICDGEHAWANVKCDLLDCVHEWVVEKGNSFCVWCSVPEQGEFVYSPCANPACDVEYASGEYCSLCEK